MKKSVNKLVMTLMFGLFAGMAWASNISITEKPELVDGAANQKLVKFSLSWDYSWRTVDPNNWDAAWVFVKYRVGSYAWDHMYLDAGYAPKVGDDNGVEMTSSFGRTDDKSRVVGVFLYREKTGRGTIKWEDITLGWRYNVTNGYLGNTTVTASDEVTVKVFAIEMVYVPKGDFFLGSGASSLGEFCRADQLNTVVLPYLVESEAAISVRARHASQAALDLAIDGDVAVGLSTVSNSFAINVTNGIGVVGTDAIPGDFPKGHQAFYCMKYEITQGAYVDFLNTLTVVQQGARTRVAPNSAAGTRAMQQANASDRNYIKILKSGSAEYGCDMNNNGILDEDMDGQNVACAMNINDLMAYLAFSGMRPMTELEFEKACRGTRDPVPNEFAWGSTYFNQGNSGSSAPVAAVPASAVAFGSTGFATGTYGLPNERPATVGTNIMTHATQLNAQALVSRNGVFANDSTGRVVSGATFWGIMEMSGNLWEFCINVINAQGRAYTGLHGDGRLTAGGTHNVLGWPDYFGFGLRGGSVGNAVSVGGAHAVSERSAAFWNTGVPGNTMGSVGNTYSVGGRGVRTAGI
jgi:formylglycine-generating enzyme required for sulfatase activity